MTGLLIFIAGMLLWLVIEVRRLTRVVTNGFALNTEAQLKGLKWLDDIRFKVLDLNPDLKGHI